MAINYNNDPYNQGLGNLDIGNMQTAGLLPEFMGGTSDAEDAAQDSLEQIQNLRQQENAIKSMGEGAIELKQDELKSIQNQIQNIKNQNKDFQEFKDIGGLTANANNIMSDANYVYSDVPELSSGIMQMLNNQQNYEPQYRIRDQLNRDFLQGGLFRDAKQGLGQTKDALFEDFSGLTEGLGSIKNKYFDPAVDKVQGYGKKGIDWGKMAVRGIGNVIMPGLGYAIDAFQRPEYPSDAMSKSFAYGNQNAGNDYGYYNDLRHGNLTGQDQFGINTISMMGNYPAYYDQYARDYKAGKYSPTSKFAANKYAHAQEVAAANQARIERDFTVTAEDEEGAGNYVAPATTNNGGGGGNDNTGGDSGSIGASDQFSNRSGRGRTGYGRGGIASLWQR